MVEWSCAGASSEHERSGSFQIIQRAWPEGRKWAPTISYSQSEALFASTHVVQGRCASHLCGGIVVPLSACVEHSASKNSPFSLLWTGSGDLMSASFLMADEGGR